MEAQFKTRDGRLVVKFEATNQKELFELLAKNEEVFDSDVTCGCCHKANLRYRVREVAKDKKTFKYYERTCTECGARLQFGQSNDTVSLFPKRKDGDGNWMPDHGWAKWVPKDEQ
jgi:hypothetical protein